MSHRKPLFILTGIFTVSVISLAAVYCSFPKLKMEEKAKVRLPRNVDDARELGMVLSKYKEDNYAAVFTGILVVYIFLQSFAIPGSIFLSILSGYLFPFPVALAMICTCSATGASICYLLSDLVGKAIVLRYWEERVEKWSLQVGKHRENLLNYIIFLRITPFIPNWFINIAAPIIDVPLSPFFWGTFIGVAPPSIFFVQAGTTLEKMTRSINTFNWTSVIVLAVCALLSLAPVFFRSKLKAKIS